ncbi:hypothetical protein P7K49_020244 [Saguinus oedipus]|uniref:Translation initiation factor IF-2-like n=1 Tax=Saguinus oedipus TaxID=9490 RepID=A0ABQ9V294_SAGOE|nr:hypothetical protein P7K49_020244 [Saguinus oedipus]
MARAPDPVPEVASPRRGMRWFALHTSLFGAVPSAERERERRGARGGRGRAGPRAGPRPGTSRAPRTRPAQPAGRVTRPSLAHSPAAGQAGGRLRPCRGRDLGRAGGRRAPGYGLLAMSSVCDAGDHYPLHLLVWNNDYRQLEKELQGQVRGGGIAGNRAGVVSPP